MTGLKNLQNYLNTEGRIRICGGAITWPEFDSILKGTREPNLDRLKDYSDEPTS